MQSSFQMSSKSFETSIYMHKKQHAFMNKCSFLNQCNPFKMCTAAFDTPIFGTMCSPLNQNSLLFKIQDFFAEIFMRNIQFFSFGKNKAFLHECSLPFKMSSPRFQKGTTVEQYATFCSLPSKLWTASFQN